ncbi:MAG: copper homeostasis protein CutC [Lachnospiraceae bacterium]|nr:copper homeostasis protein CutC [Lachnospiraceae bacterium]
MILEVCVDSVESAVNAELGGADRIELCGDLIVGGITPSLALYERIREKTELPIHVLLRPRFGDFLYSEEELEVLIRQAKMFAEAGADNLVIGCLTPEGRLDLEAMKRIIDAADGTPVNLHRAFDMCRDLSEALEDAKTLGVVSILTSGGVASAKEGAKVLDELKKNAGDIDIMAGAGMNAQNIKFMLNTTSITSFHMSGKKVLESNMQYRNPNVNMGLPTLSEYEIIQTDVQEVRAAKLVMNMLNPAIFLIRK